MIVYLSAISTMERDFDAGHFDPSEISVLASFYGISDFEKKNAGKFKSILIDSGAFSFLRGKSVTDWDKYIEEYAAFINRYNIDLFFELDIDTIVGLKEVERLRAKLERLSGKQPIPVWHKGRGIEYFPRMCQEYKYVALGGIAIKEIPRNKFEAAFPWFINTAHKYGAKIHGLGYTDIKGMHKYHFDSVDSTTWLVGAKYGNACYVKYGRGGVSVPRVTPRLGQRVKNPADLSRRNFKEWIKFQQYAEKYL